MSQRQLITCAFATVAAVAFTAGISRAQSGNPNQCSHAAQPRDSEGGARQSDGRGEERTQQPHVGHHRRSRRRRLRSRVLRKRSRRAVARKPRHLRAESEHGERVRPRFDVQQRRLWPGGRPRAVDGESLFISPQRRNGAAVRSKKTRLMATTRGVVGQKSDPCVAAPLR